MGKWVRRLLRRLGWDVVRIQKQSKTERTGRVSFHRTLTGDYFLPADAHADAIVQAIKFDRVFDVEVYDVIRKYIIPGTAALDVGSNFGQMAVLMSRLVGSSGIVHAFEADDFVFELLKKNVAANASNIIAHFGAVHHTGGEVLFFPVQDFERFGTYGSYGIDKLSTATGCPFCSNTSLSLRMN